MKINSNDKGQTLLEVIAAIAIASLVIASMLSLATKSNRNANFARSTAQASKIAQQGIEVIRNIRDENEQDYVTTDLCSSGCRWSDMYSTNLSPLANLSYYNFYLVRPPSGCPAAAVSWCIFYGTGTPGPNPENISTDLGNFTRVVRIEDDNFRPDGSDNACNSATLTNTSSKLVIVIVKWDDPSGSHTSEVSSCITAIR